MGHKVSPIAWRIGQNRTWSTTGYFDRHEYKDGITLDILLRDYVQHFLRGIPVGNIYITHSDNGIRVSVHTSKVSLVLGKNGEQHALLEKKLSDKFHASIKVDVKEIKNPDTHAAIIADSVARQIERRLPYRRVVKQALAKAMEKGAKGIKIRISGRINGVDIARTETYKEGNIPTQTIRSYIDYVTEKAHTQYGIIGLKVWIYKGES